MTSARLLMPFLFAACAGSDPTAPLPSEQEPPEEEEVAEQVDAGSALDARVVLDAARGDASAEPDARITTLDASTGAAFARPRCVKKDSQLIILGDSYFNWISHTFPDDIKRVTGQSWRFEAVPGYSMATGGWGSIPQTLTDSLARDPDAHTKLMTGGGNDILLPDAARASLYECTNKGAHTKKNCQDIVAEAIAKARAVMLEAADAGIRDIVYSFYPHVPANTIATGDGPGDILDYALPQVRETCADVEAATNGRTRCLFVDLVPYFADHDSWYNFADIHPSPAGSAKMAELYWKVMSEACIGQKAKACCE
jgi:hypothetical protein